MAEHSTFKMTHDEMIDVLKGLVFGTFDRTTAKEREALNMAIQSLEQEPKIGHWVRWYEIIEEESCTIHDPHCKCSECSKEYDPYISQFIKYCPNCGAKMESEE